MGVTLYTLDGTTRWFGDGDRAGDSPATIPCFCCGVCCERWQPLIGREEAERLATWLGLSLDDFLRDYTQPYPFDDQRWLLQRNEREACIFLDYDERGATVCTVHPVKPDACAAWEASLMKKECRQGLQRMGKRDALLLPAELYSETEQVWLLHQAMAVERPNNEAPPG